MCSLVPELILHKKTSLKHRKTVLEIKKCPEQVNEIKYGSVFCTSSNEIGSTCTYRCNTNYKLTITSKQEFLVHHKICGEDRTWSSDYVPECVSQECNRLQTKVLKLFYFV